MKTITKKINQLTYKRYSIELKQMTQTMRRHMFLLSIFSIAFLFILFFNPFGTSSELEPSVDLQRQQRVQMYKAHLAENNEELITYSKYKHFNQTYKPSDSVIVFLVASFTGDPRLAYNPYPRLREKIIQLDGRFDDNNITDVIVFHTGYPFYGDLIPIFEVTARQVEFVNIDHVFSKFSPGFDPHIRDPTWTQKGKWNYHHMCYFWFKHVFELKIMKRYRYMMRLDDDSQILGKWPNVFHIMTKRKALYLANKRETDIEYVLPGLTLVRNLTATYIAQNKISVRNPAMLNDVFNHTIEVPIFWTHFEVIDLLFIRRDDVIDFIETVDESKGIFLYRWGDSLLRYITLALFADETQILHRRQLELFYCHPC